MVGFCLWDCVGERCGCFCGERWGDACGPFLEAGRGANFEHFGGGVGSELLLRQFFSFFPLFFIFFLKQLNCASTSDILYIYGR